MDDELNIDEGTPVEMVDDGMGGTIPAPVEESPEENRDPWAGAPDEVRDFAQRSGFKSVEDLAKSYQELRREFTRSRQQEPAQREPEPRRPAVPQSNEVNYEAIVDAADGDPAVALALYDQHVIGPKLQAMLDERFGDFEQTKIAPLSQVAGSMYWEGQATKLRNQHPDLFDEVAPEIEDIFVNDPSLAERPDGMTIAFERVMGRRYATERARSRASQINTGGRGSRPGGKDVDPAQAVRDAIRNAAGFGDRSIG